MSGTIALGERNPFTLELDGDLTALDGPGLPAVMPAPMAVAMPAPVAVEVLAEPGQQEARGRLDGLAAKIRTLLHHSRAKP
jgi:hypothetical protein